jgi:prevent-host-death family protein
MEASVRNMQSVGVRELKERATEIVRRVRTRGATVEITYRGKVVARLVPVRESARGATPSSEIWTSLDQLAAEIGAHWPKNVSAVDAVREGRMSREVPLKVLPSCAAFCEPLGSPGCSSSSHANLVGRIRRYGRIIASPSIGDVGDIGNGNRLDGSVT